jgi:hypothetical protein
LIWASCPDARARNGVKAIESATAACELTHWSDASTVEVLAAAYAETGKFDKAVRWQVKANSLHVARDAQVSGQLRLKLYERNVTYREPGS